MAKKNWKIIPVDDFVIFKASDDIVESANANYARANELNRRYVADRPVPEPPVPVTGTFICAQPPNYRGLPMLHASVEDWQKKFELLKTFGVDTVIFQAAVWFELGTVYYPSRRFADFRKFDQIGNVLTAAERTGLDVYLGGYGSVSGWCMGKDPAYVEQETQNHFAVQDELFELYGGRFKGIYFAPETAYRGERDTYTEKALNSIYRDFCGRLKKLHPECTIVMSPATKYFEGKLDEMVESWNTILDGVQLDVMAPQDSIGCCGNTLEHQEIMFQVWRRICDGKDIRFWSNVELFEDVDCSKVDSLIPADPRRIAHQICNAAKVAEKLISWEMLYLTDDSCGGRGAALRSFLQRCNTLCRSRQNA
ncbi:MAG: DUF4434 domain-containing protein [Lentisphaeria bacterium]|nr:DUF4434 domain-containing protein [Lentisphaeria bacterium]